MCKKRNTWTKAQAIELATKYYNKIGEHVCVSFDGKGYIFTPLLEPWLSKSVFRTDQDL